jgi:hypothetical protein
MFYTRPLNPPILGDFRIRPPHSWGAEGPSAIMVRLSQQCWVEGRPYKNVTLIVVGFWVGVGNLLSFWAVIGDQRFALSSGNRGQLAGDSTNTL